MAWSSDWLYSLLLDLARDTFVEAVGAASERSELRPKMLVATEHPGWNRETTTTSGDPLRIWSSEDDFTSLIDPRTWQSIEQQQDGRQSIHSIPLFSWLIPLSAAVLEHDD